MINVRIETDSDGNTLGITVDGHAGYDEYGKDIVCAAVSALTVNMANSVEHFTNDRFEAECEEGFFRFRFPGKASHDATLLMNALVLGLQDVQESCGEEYMRIRFEEV